MSRKTMFVAAALVSIMTAGVAVAQDAKQDAAKKPAAAKSEKKAEAAPKAAAKADKPAKAAAPAKKK